MRVSGGWRVDADNRVRGTYTHNPSSLRLSMVDPNLQQIPRGGGLDKYVKECFVAPEGFLLWERDFSAIEAVLVGYFAGSPDYIRFSKLGVHDFLASHMLHRPADLSWSDSVLKDYFAEIKKNHKETRDNAKRVVHGSNYMMSPRRMFELFPESFKSTKDAATLQGLYFDLFPTIRKWHRDLCDRVDGTKRRKSVEGDADPDPWTLGVCYARNPFGYVHHFYNVLDWDWAGVDTDGKNIWVSSFGEDAKRLVSFLPQSTAAAIIKQAAKRLYQTSIGDTLRLLIHDSIMGEAKEDEVKECLEVSQRIMEAPIEEIPLDPSWNLGTHLTIGTEAKVGRSWGGMS